MTSAAQAPGSPGKAVARNMAVARDLLRAPLGIKLGGANLIIVIVAWVAAYLTHSPAASDWRMLSMLLVALLLGLAVNLVLVSVALRPIRDLERAATRVWAGDLSSRVPRSPIADADLAQIGGTLNFLLTSLARDRQRIRKLASEVVRAGDRERSRVGKELHDSVAQSLAALRYQLVAVEREATGPELREQIRAVRESAGELLEEVRVLSHTVHPQILDDLGLVPALRRLARTTVGEAIVTVTESGDMANVAAIAPDAAAALYRAAEESIGNAIRHGAPSSIEVRLGAVNGAVSLQVDDNGAGFDLATIDQEDRGMGLFTMRERMALVGGSFDITSAPRKGTTVRVSVPVDPARISPPNEAPAILESYHAR